VCAPIPNNPFSDAVIGGPVFSGNVIGGAMSGTMTWMGYMKTKLPLQGCWHATMATIPTVFATEMQVDQAERLDSGGGKKK